MHRQMDDLIEAVRKHPTLWDISSRAYKDHAKRADAWLVVADETGIPQEIAKSKWRGLRDTYIKFLKAQKRTTEQGRKKQKKYCYAERMAFMKPLLVNIRSRVTVREQFHQSEPEMESKESKAEQICPPKIVTHDQNGYLEGPTERRTHKTSDSRHDFVELLMRVQSLEKDVDTTDMLFLTYARTLKHFSKRRQILMKRKIAEIFADAELEQLMEDETEYATPCLSYPTTFLVNTEPVVTMQETVECKIEGN